MTHSAEPRRPRLIPATARVEPERKPTKAAALKRHRQASAWMRHAEKKERKSPR